MSFLLYFFTTILLLQMNISSAFGETDTYEFGNSDDCSWLYVGEGDVKYVVYNGKRVSIVCDYFTFIGRGDDLLDEYSLCVTPIYFNDTDCAVELQIKTSIFGSSQHKITCNENNKNRYCGPQDEFLYIEFHNRAGRPLQDAKFKLLITAEKKFDYGEMVGAIVGGVIGGLVLITVCIAVFCWCVCRRKPSQGTVINQTQRYPAPGNPYVVYSAQAQQGTMGASFIAPSPGVHSMTSNAPPDGVPNTQTTDNKMSAAPPSYETLTSPSYETPTSPTYETLTS